MPRSRIAAGSFALTSLVSLTSVPVAAVTIAACSSDTVSTDSSSPATSDGGTNTDPTMTSGEGGAAPTGDGGATPGTDGSTGPSTGATKTNCKYTAHQTGLTPLQQAGGLSFNVYAPASYDPNVGHAVIVIMHGQDSNGVPELTALWKPIADTAGENLVLVAPKGSRPATNGDATAGNWGTGDLDNVLAVMTLVDDCYDVFPKKHLLWGFSEGTFYGYLLGIGAADRFSGLAMGGANASFARDNGYPPSAASWKFPVSHVHGTDDMNAISITYQDRDDFIAAGHVFTLHEHPGGHTITPEQVLTQYGDLKASSSP